jgi:capsular exopolysaccharide synthesis family protein
MKEPRDLIRPQADIGSFVPVEVIRPPAGYAGAVGADDELELRNYWRVVQRRLKLVISLTALGTILTGIYMANKPDIYEAQARVQVDAERFNPAMNPAKSDAVLFSDPTYFSTQLQVLSSSALLRKVVKALDLEHNSNFLKPKKTGPMRNLLSGFHPRANVEEGQQGTPAEASPLTSLAAITVEDDPAEGSRLAPYVEMLQSGLEIEPVKEARLKVTETRLIDVRFTHTDRQVATKVANAVAEVFVLMNLQKRTLVNTTTDEFLQKRIGELQAQIRTDEERLMNYANNNQILSLDASQNTVVERLVGLSKQLLEAENERKNAEAAYRASLAPGAAAALAEGTNKHNSDIESKLAELRARRSDLLVENTEEWPEVKEVSQQIAALERELNEARTRGVSTVKTNLETKYRQALDHEQSLRTAFNQQRTETLTQNQAAVNYRIIQQEIETSKNLLNGLLQRAKENEVVMAGTLNNMSVIDRAIPPRNPVGPQRLLTVGLAFMVSLLAGVGLALLLERLDTTIRSTGDVELLQLPALASIPSARKLLNRYPLQIARAFHNGNGKSNGSNHAALLITNGMQSPVAEAYRHLRTSIMLSRQGHSIRTILVTSSHPRDGKTTTSVNLATSLAQTGERVLIIDADMRQPRLHSIFGIANEFGLSTLLADDKEVDPNIFVEWHEATGVNVLPGGPAPLNAAELVGSPKMWKLLSFFQSNYTHIVIDSPPIASFTDGVVMASLVDGVVLVVQGGKSSREVVRRSRQVLQDAGATILGVVLNKVNLRSQEYDYYYNY